MTNKKGILYGLGVGPGDPELITLKAARILNTADVVYAAASTKNSYSLAVSIARPHIPDLTPVKMLRFPMTSDQTEKETAWKDHARTLISEIEKGKIVAFLTLGDSMTYSTYGYVLEHVQKLAPHVDVISVPGITSYQASAACMNTPLVEGEGVLMVVSGAQGGNRFRRIGATPDTLVFLKAYKNVKDIRSALDENDLLETSVAVKNCSLPDQEIIKDIKALETVPPNYWTLILAKKK